MAGEALTRCSGDGISAKNANFEFWDGSPQGIYIITKDRYRLYKGLAVFFCGRQDWNSQNTYQINGENAVKQAKNGPASHYPYQIAVHLPPGQGGSLNMVSKKADWQLANCEFWDGFGVIGRREHGRLGRTMSFRAVKQTKKEENHAINGLQMDF